MRETKVQAARRERIERLLAAWASLRDALSGNRFDDVHEIAAAAGRSKRQLLNVPDERGQTLLHSAIDSARIDEVRVLLECGADANYKHNYRAPLEMAAQAGSVPILEMLLEHGARLNECSKLRNLNALMVAIGNVREPAALFLIKRGIECGEEVVDSSGVSCASMSLARDLAPVVMALEKRGAVNGNVLARAVFSDALKTALAYLAEPSRPQITGRQRAHLLASCASESMGAIIRSASSEWAVLGAVSSMDSLEEGEVPSTRSAPNIL